MQPAHPSHNVHPRPQVEVVSIPEQNLDSQFLQHILRHALHGRDGANGHEDGSFDHAMRGRKLAETRRTAGRFNLKLDGHCGELLQIAEARLQK